MFQGAHAKTYTKALFKKLHDRGRLGVHMEDSFLHRGCTRAAPSLHQCVILVPVVQHFCNSATVLLQENGVKYKLN